MSSSLRLPVACDTQGPGGPQPQCMILWSMGWHAGDFLLVIHCSLNAANRPIERPAPTAAIMNPQSVKSAERA